MVDVPNVAPSSKGPRGVGYLNMPRMPLLLWENPLNSGIIFTSGIVLYAILEVLGMSVLELGSRLVLYTLCVSLLFVAGRTLQIRFLNAAPLLADRSNWVLSHIRIREEDVQPFVRAGIESANALIDQIKAVMYVMDIKQSLGVLVGAFLGQYVFSSLSFMTVAFLVHLASFSLPKAYVHFYSLVDPHLIKLAAKINELLAKLPAQSAQSVRSQSHAAADTASSLKLD